MGNLFAEEKKMHSRIKLINVKRRMCFIALLLFVISNITSYAVPITQLQDKKPYHYSAAGIPKNQNSKVNAFLEKAKSVSPIRTFSDEDFKICGSVEFSKPAGEYENEFMLELSTDLPGGVIHYTLDGSEPTKASPVYSGPVNIHNRTAEPNVISEINTVVNEGFVPAAGNLTKGTTVSARAFNSLGQKTEISVNSYFPGISLSKRYGLKVVSITVPQNKFFDPQTGVYSYNNSKAYSNKTECDAYMEIFNRDSKRVVSQPVGIRLNGASTREYQQKSLRIYARNNEEYKNHKKAIKYDLFNGTISDNKNKPIKEFKRIILRNGGNDWENYFMKNEIVQDVAGELNNDTQASTGCVVFLNGEFFGFFRMLERYDNQYFKYHYNLKDKDDAVLLAIANNPNEAELNEGTQEDLKDFHEKINFAINNDMSVKENYEKAASYFDIDSLIDHYIVNVYFENFDWPHNNVKIWRNKNTENSIDTKYRFLISDEDDTLADMGEMFIHNFEKHTAWESEPAKTLGYDINKVDCLLSRFMKAMLANEDFKTRFITRYNDCINTVFAPENVKNAIEKYFNVPKNIIDEQRIRYPQSRVKTETSELNAWAEARPRRAREELETYFDFAGTGIINVNFKAKSWEGYICANTLKLKNNTEDGYKASYYRNYPINFRAVPAKGYKFKHFLINNQICAGSDYYEFNFSKDTVVEAVFEKEE